MGVIGKEEVGKIAVGRVENSPHGGGASGASLGRVWGEFGARLCPEVPGGGGDTTLPVVSQTKTCFVI